MALTTNIVYKIGIHATAGTSKPSVPNKGSHVTLTGFVELGSVDRGDDANLDEETITLPFARAFSTIKGPLDLAAQDHVLNSAGATDFSFALYDVREDVFALDSNLAITSHVGEFDHATTKRTVVIEINGLMMMYFPQCVVTFDQLAAGAAGEKAAGRTMVTVKPEATSSIPGGVDFSWFQAA